MSLTYLLIEDEPPARARLKRLLTEVSPDCRCLGEAGDGLAGLEMLRSTPAEVLFLDIQFPPDGAFGLLARARAAGLVLPALAFVTAYDQHALEAFRWAACDYLLKPVDRDHLRETLARVRPRPAEPRVAADLGLLLQALEASRRQQPPERFTVLVKGRLRVLAWAQVSHLRTENRLLFVHTSEGHFVLDRTLDELEGLLGPAFLRCHRSAMVRLEAVLELEGDPGGTGELRLRGDARVPVSRERMAEVRKALGAR